MKRAAVYLRISRDVTGQEAGVGRQREDCKALVDERGWDVAEEFVDNDTSAYSGRIRPAFQRLLEAINSGSVDVVVAYHVDRLYRRLRDLVPLLEACEKHGVDVVTVRAGDLDLSTAAGRTIASILGAVAEGESARQAERIRREKQQRAAAGKPNGGMRSFGYDADGSVNAAEANAIRHLTERVLAGESLISLTKWLIAEGVPTVRGGVWRTSAIRNILLSPKIAGLRAHQPTAESRRRGSGRSDPVTPEWATVVRAVWDPIITEQQHKALVDLFTAPDRKWNSRTPMAPLTNVLRCGGCGAGLNAANGPKGGSRYICASVPGQPNCGKLGIAAHRVEEYVFGAMASSLYDEQGNRPAPPTPEPVIDTEAITKAESKLRELAGMYAEDRITMTEWMAQRDILEKRLTALSTPTTDHKAARRASLPQTRDEFVKWITDDEIGADVKRAVVTSVIDKIVVAQTGRSGPRFNPDRLDIQWLV